MFISSEYISINYGVNDKIARFFVDREPPVDNLYWHKKLLYLRPSAGYIFIPLIVDLLYRLGISREQLLSHSFIDTMEAIGHISALEEIKQIDAAVAVQQCAELVAANCNSQDWYNDVYLYLKNDDQSIITSLASPYKALHRGDVFLFSVCQLSFPADIKQKIVQQWFALITTLLLLDDADDLESDLKTNEENAFVESGLTTKGIEEIQALVETNLATIATLNRTMANQLQREFKEMIAKPELTKFIN